MSWHSELRVTGGLRPYSGSLPAIRLFTVCRGLTEDDCLDVVQSAITDLYALLASPDTSPVHVDTSLRQALERHRKRAKRRNLRLAHPDPERCSVSPSDALIARRHFFEVVEEIEAVLSKSLLSLSQRDRKLMESYYRAKVSSDRSSANTALNYSAHRKALWRARRRLNEELERRLISELEKAERRRACLKRHLP